MANPEHIQRLSLKGPPFWAADPELWFSQLDSQFLLNGITRDETKFAYTVGNLDSKIAAEVKDIIISPPETNK